MNKIVLVITFSFIILCGFFTPPRMNTSAPTNKLLDSLLSNNKSLMDVWKNTDNHRLQIIYSRVTHDSFGNVQLKNYTYNLSEDLYFYPASLVNLPVSIFALEKLKAFPPDVDITIDSKISIESNYSCQSSVISDDMSINSRPTLKNYISKALIISDNDSYNRLYEFVGPEYCQKRLSEMGYGKAQIVTRFSRCNSVENMHTNAFNFYNEQGEVMYRQPPAFCDFMITPPLSNMKVGHSHFTHGKIIASPKDFANHNCFPLQNMHDFLIGLIYPSVDRSPFLIDKKEREFILHSLSAKPNECSIKKIKNDTTFYDNYTNYLFYGAENKKPENDNLKIYNIVGQSYGFLSDIAYFQNTENGIDFFLSAVLYTNSSEIVGDNIYEYETIGFPFLRDLGKIVYNYELDQQLY